MKNNIFAVDQGKPSESILTRIVGYYLDMDNRSERAQYQAICAEREEKGVKLFDCISRNTDATPRRAESISLETAYIFENQWNSEDGRRVFDWYESIVPNKKIKIGYYLQITPEMVKIRKNTCKCGYCGAEYYGAKNAGLFCPKCLDSEYLKESDLRLLRVMPCDKDYKRNALNVYEDEVLTAEYVYRQTTAQGSRAVEKRGRQKKDILKKYDDERATGEAEKNGLLWLWERFIPLDNVIYFSHTKTFCFGWRNALSAGVKSELLQKLEGFPYPYTFK